MTTFGVLAKTTNIVSGASECSCWCVPELGNILPYAIPRDQVYMLLHVTVHAVNLSYVPQYMIVFLVSLAAHS